MYRILVLLGLTSLLCPLSFAKEKSVLPADVLRAETVLVVIESDAGEPLTDPSANSNSREDVERAITKWGRFKLVIDSQTADLIISQIESVPIGHNSIVESRCLQANVRRRGITTAELQVAIGTGEHRVEAHVV